MARPDGLTGAEAAHWDTLAPLAHSMRTLTAETAPTFVLLCQTLADRDQARAALAADGLMVDGAVHPASTHARQLTARCEALLTRYSLSATARPTEVPKAPEAAENPWARAERLKGGEYHDFYGEAPGPKPVKGR